VDITVGVNTKNKDTKGITEEAGGKILTEIKKQIEKIGVLGQQEGGQLQDEPRDQQGRKIYK